MKVWGLYADSIRRTLAAIDLETENLCQRGRAIQFRMVPHSAFDAYARTSASGRHLRSCCYHGLRDGLTALFAAGATRIQTATDGTYTEDGMRTNRGDWTSLQDFRDALPDLYELNIGSMDEPFTMAKACNCETVGVSYLTSAVKESCLSDG